MGEGDEGAGAVPRCGAGAPPPPVDLTRIARNAMGGRCEIALYGGSPSHLRAAGEQALAEISRLESQLGLFVGSSQIAQVNAHAAFEPVLVTPEVFRLLALCRDLWRDTAGAFDITISPLMHCWGFRGGEPRVPSDEELAGARERVGMQHLLLDQEERTVRFARPGMALDLGAIGKGYAIERAADALRDLEIPGALLHAGTSSVYSLGVMPDGRPWPVAVAAPGAPDRPAFTLHLQDQGLSVSGVHGQGFAIAGRYYGHVMDPRTGRPTQGLALAAVTHPSPTIAEALSTALLVAGETFAGTIRQRWPEAVARCQLS